MTSQLLPEQYKELERFVSEWALPSESQRNHKRLASSMEEIQKFYDALLPRLNEILSYLNQYPLEQLPAEAQRLMELSLSLMEISHAVELYGQPDVPDAFDARRFEIVLDI